MIFYKRTEWYGLQYLLKLDGSLLPKTLPSMILAGVISGLTAAGYVDHVFQDDVEYSDMCSQRAANGYDSGMGEIFRRVAAITPVGSDQLEAPDAVGALL